MWHFWKSKGSNGSPNSKPTRLAQIRNSMPQLPATCRAPMSSTSCHASQAEPSSSSRLRQSRGPTVISRAKPLAATSITCRLVHQHSHEASSTHRNHDRQVSPPEDARSPTRLATPTTLLSSLQHVPQSRHKLPSTSVRDMCHTWMKSSKWNAATCHL